MVPPAPKPAQQPFDFFNADARQKLRGLQPQLPAAATTRRVRRRIYYVSVPSASATRLRHIHGVQCSISLCGATESAFDGSQCGPL